MDFAPVFKTTDMGEDTALSFVSGLAMT